MNHDAFMKLCEHVEYSDHHHQFSITELESLMRKYSDDGGYYTTKHLKFKLQEHYRDSMIITCDSGKETINAILDETKRILRDNYNSIAITPEDDVDMAATLTDDQMSYPLLSCLMEMTQKVLRLYDTTNWEKQHDWVEALVKFEFHNVDDYLRLLIDWARYQLKII